MPDRRPFLVFERIFRTSQQKKITQSTMLLLLFIVPAVSSGLLGTMRMSQPPFTTHKQRTALLSRTHTSVQFLQKPNSRQARVHDSTCHSTTTCYYYFYPCPARNLWREVLHMSQEPPFSPFTTQQLTDAVSMYYLFIFPLRGHLDSLLHAPNDSLRLGMQSTNH